jgi:hypothetical protein
MIEWTTGAEILSQLHNVTPATEDVQWADLCAGAVNAGIAFRLADAELIVGVEPLEYGTPAPLYVELRFAAITAGCEAYKRREAVFGLTGYVDLQGAAIRVSRDYLEAVAPILARYATVGIA